MIHFTCDVCGKEMHAGDKDRYVLRMELRPAKDAFELTEEDIEEDNLQKVSEILKQSEQCSEAEYNETIPVHIRFDLCPACREKFLKNPFSCQAAANFNFSEN